MPTVRVNDSVLFYESHGDGPPLVFIHGLGSSAEDWENQVPFFAKNFRVITLDLRGHFRSDKPAGPYSIALLASDIAGLMRAQRTGPVHVVGLSLGGGVAFQLALDAPELVKTLTIVNSAPEMILRTWQQKLAIGMRFAIIRLFGLPRLGEILSKRLFPDDDGLRRTFAERFAKNDTPGYLAAFRALIGWSVTARLGEIRCPTLILTADQDYTPVAFKQAYAEKIRTARLAVIPNSRHAAPMESPDFFNAALQNFLMQNP